VKDQTEQKNEEEEGESLDFNNPSYTFVPNDFHEWRQQGPYCVCKSCEIQHAVFIGINKIMVGLDEKGLPILKAR
jgi:hypothetical protein